MKKNARVLFGAPYQCVNECIFWAYSQAHARRCVRTHTHTVERLICMCVSVFAPSSCVWMCVAPRLAHQAIFRHQKHQCFDRNPSSFLTSPTNYQCLKLQNFTRQRGLCQPTVVTLSINQSGLSQAPLKINCCQVIVSPWGSQLKSHAVEIVLSACALLFVLPCGFWH